MWEETSEPVSILVKDGPAQVIWAEGLSEELVLSVIRAEHEGQWALVDATQGYEEGTMRAVVIALEDL